LCVGLGVPERKGDLERVGEVELCAAERAERKIGVISSAVIEGCRTFER
jgi:hypothetical protein